MVIRQIAIAVGVASNLLFAQLTLAKDLNTAHVDARSGIKLLGVYGQPMADRSLCAKNEVVIFSCETRKKKTISLCASPDFVKNADHYNYDVKNIGVLKYRYGKYLGAVKLEYPQGNNLAITSFKQMCQTPELGYTRAVSFHLASSRYSVFLTAVKSDYVIAGVVVDQGGELITFDECIPTTIATSERKHNAGFLDLEGYGLPATDDDISYASVAAIEMDGDKGVDAIGIGEGH